MTKTELAFEFHKKGFNCAQSVVLPFSEELKVEPTLLARGLEGFGAGMGGMELVCGALSGAVYIAGILNSDGNLDSPASKKQTYAICKNLCEKFKSECGSQICKEIKGIQSGKPTVSCNKCIEIGVELVENILKNC